MKKNWRSMRKLEKGLEVEEEGGHGDGDGRISEEGEVVGYGGVEGEPTLVHGREQHALAGYILNCGMFAKFLMTRWTRDDDDDDDDDDYDDGDYDDDDQDDDDYDDGDDDDADYDDDYDDEEEEEEEKADVE
ncbi:hypothetical protein CBR_g26361 [Chara braunii]|uniref:Uncharacterized protein n=1 Tax=Chara braunii TaxID=69332 RepID=A0A388L7W3_CHABU|nr:hypothetical protein CBR_g26361 [Chara braunii]|eukprot:GBG78332.1 hypothetical protein CBR_g26361 [Chara braunii]